MTVALDGVDAYDHSPGNVTTVALQAVFAAGASELAWAVYEFPGSVYDEIGTIEYFASERGAGDQVWMAISNYVGDSWEFLGARNLDHGTFSPSGGLGDYASPAGHTYLMVLGWDAAAFQLNQVQITYANRQPVSGQVLDLDGVGVEQATVTTSLGGPGVTTDADGNFTLPSIPQGTWQFMATKSGWVFYDIPLEAAVTDEPLSGVNFVGRYNESHFEPIDDQEPNDDWWDAPNRNPAEPNEEYISASDDPADYYRFAFTTPGQYRIRLEAEADVLFPHLTLFTKEGRPFDESSWVGRGVVYVPLAVATTRVVLVRVSCSGGGGSYVLSTETGSLFILSGKVENPAHNEVEYVLVQCDAGDESTELYSNPIDGKFFDDYMAPLSTSVTPDPLDEDPYSYTPTSALADLTSGDVTMGMDFTGDAAFLSDPHEPNDDSATAYALGTLPVIDEGGIIDAGDGDDWYSFTPTAGKHFMVQLKFDYTREEFGGPPLQLSIINHDQSLTAISYHTDFGEEVRSRDDMVADGNDYYVHVSCGDTRMYAYLLSIEEFDGRQLQLGALWQTAADSFGLDGARIELYDLTDHWMQRLGTGADGLTAIPFFFQDGEKLYAEIFRYGTALDRDTRHFTFDGDDLEYWFSCKADECADAWEPNNSYPMHLDFPVELDATLSVISDSWDKYLFTPGAANVVHVGVSTPGDGFAASLDLYDNVTDTYLGGRSFSGSGDFYFPSGGPVEHRLEFSNYDPGSESPYHMTINAGAGYMLSGTVLDSTSHKVDNSYLYCPALNYGFAYFPVDGSYELGPFPPGTYQVLIYGPNYASDPPSPFTLNVVDSDVTQNFVLNSNYTDVGEPNDTWNTASGPLASGVPVSANVGNVGDGVDYWKFTIATPGLINAYITFQQGFGEPGLTLYDSDGTTKLMESELYDTGYQRVDYNLTAASTYYLAVDAFGANDYKLAVNY